PATMPPSNRTASIISCRRDSSSVSMPAAYRAADIRASGGLTPCARRGYNDAMSDATLKKLSHLIAACDSAELSRAAILVPGALGSGKERELIKSLLGVLGEADPSLRQVAVDALGQLGAEEALPKLVELVRQGGAELESAARAAGRLGARGAKAMAKLM